MKDLIIILVFLSLGINLFAQNFEQYYHQAADNHPTLKAIFNEYYAVLQQKKQVNKLPSPELAFGVFILPVETRLGAQRFRTGLSQMFPPIGQLKAKSSLVDKQAAVKLQQAAVQRNELYSQLQESWYQLLKISELLKVDSQQLKRLDVFEQLALQKIEIGKGSTANVYRIKLKRNELLNNMNLLENKVAAVELEFRTILGTPDDNSAKIELPDTILLRVLPYTKDSLAGWIHNQNPSLELLELKKDALAQKKMLRKTQNRPSFGVGIDYVWVTKRTDANPAFNGQDILMPKASIKIPLYKSQNQARLKEVDLELLAVEDWANHLENILNLKLEQAFAQYQEAQLELAHYEEQIRFTKKIIDVLIANYSVDVQDFEELLRMEDMFFVYARKKVQSKIKQNMAIVRIEKLFAQAIQ